MSQHRDLILLFMCLVSTVLIFASESTGATAPALQHSLSQSRENAQTPQAPRLRFAENEVEYGHLLQGEIVEKEVEVFNDGDRPLIITKATPSCGCTTVMDFPQSIPAGGKAKLRFEINSKKIKPGDSRKRIRLDTNDPLAPRGDFFFTSEVIKLYQSDPAEIVVGGLYDQEKRVKVRVRGSSSYGFELLGAASREGKFEIEEFLLLDIGEYELTLKIPAATEPGSVRDPLDFLIGVDDGRQIQVGQWVNIEHWDPIDVQPANAIQFGNRDTDPLLIEGSPPVVKQIMLRSRSEDRSFQVLGVQLLDLPEGAFEAEVIPVVEGSSYVVEVRLPAYRKEVFLSGKIVITTDASINPERTLFVRARFGRKR